MIRGAYEADRTASVITDFTRDLQWSNDMDESDSKERAQSRLRQLNLCRRSKREFA